ncbi:hypothetical protein NECAME_18044, partial [Necator americanus]
MLGKNASRFPSIYEKAEELLRAVENVDSQFADWLVLAQIDMEQLIEEKLTTAADWEAQMKLLKTKGREAEKLPRQRNSNRMHCGEHSWCEISDRRTSSTALRHAHMDSSSKHQHKTANYSAVPIT